MKALLLLLISCAVSAAQFNLSTGTLNNGTLGAPYIANAYSFPGSSNAASINSKGVIFKGLTDSSGELDNNINTSKGCLSLWWAPVHTNGYSSGVVIVECGVNRFHIWTAPTNNDFTRLEIQVVGTDGAADWKVTTSAYTNDGTLHHVIASFRFDNPFIGTMYVDGIYDTQVITAPGFHTIQWTCSGLGSPTNWSFGGDPIQPGRFAAPANIALLWLNTTNYMNVSNLLVRNLFARTNNGVLKPVDLGPDGSYPGFGQPILYFSDTAANITNNMGYGGKWTNTIGTISSTTGP